MYPRSFLCEEAKIKQRTPLKKELCEIGEEAIWESRFTSFFFKYKWRVSRNEIDWLYDELGGPCIHKINVIMKDMVHIIQLLT